MDQNELEERLSDVPPKRHQTIVDIVKEANGSAQIVHSHKVVPPEKALTPRRAHVFCSRKAFVDYANLVTSNRSVFLIDPSTGNSELIIDESVKDGGVETIKFQPAYSLQFAAWAGFLNVNITFESLRDLIAKRKSEIVTCKAIDKDGKDVTYDVRALRRMLNQITVSSTVKVHDGSGNGAINGVTAETKVKAGTQENEFSLPEQLVINVPVFADEDGGPVNVDIQVVPFGGGAAVKLLCGDLEDIKTAYYAKVLADMRAIGNGDGDKDGFPCGYGVTGHKEHLFVTN